MHFVTSFLSGHVLTVLRHKLPVLELINKLSASHIILHHLSTVCAMWSCSVANINTFTVVAGIWLHESGVLGASPDGVANLLPESRLCPSVNVAAREVLVEVKCPYTARDMTVTTAAVNCKNFFLGKCSYCHFFSQTSYSCSNEQSSPNSSIIVATEHFHCAASNADTVY